MWAGSPLGPRCLFRTFPPNTSSDSQAPEQARDWPSATLNGWACLILLVLGWVFRPFLPALKRFHHAGIPGAALQPLLRRVPGEHLDHRLRLHQDFRAPLCGSVVLERVVGWKLWETAIVLVVATGIYTIAGGLAAVIYTDLVQTLILIVGAVILTVIGLHRVGGFAGAARGPACQLFPHDQAGQRSGLSLDGYFLRRADSRHLVLVYRSGDRAARALRQGRRSRQSRHYLRRLPQDTSRVHAGAAGTDRCRPLPHLFKIGPNGEVLNGDIAYPTMIINLLPTGLVGS